MFVLGIDIGTQGTRCIISDIHGHIISQAELAFPVKAAIPGTDGHFEQDPDMWHRAMLTVIKEAVSSFTANGHQASEIRAISATSTSGTLCLTDEQGQTLGLAIMYSDNRAQSVMEQLHQDGASQEEKLGIRYTASFALARLYWLRKNEPALLAQARWAASPTDLALQWLGAKPGITDWSNALKTGYDIAEFEWPAFIPTEIRSLLPEVVAPGTVIGAVSVPIADELGLHPGTLLVAGASDGTAAQLASGAVNPGDWNTTIGTTLVIKGVTENLLRDPLGRVYCHRHPEGHWLPGGASNTGADCIVRRFDNPDLLDASPLPLEPIDAIVYPLERRGERFPFVAPQAEGFVLGELPDEPVYQYRAYLEGLAYLERLAYDTLESLGAIVGKRIYSVGGATKSRTGCQLRADILQREIVVPEAASGAMGAAILAACGCAYGLLSDATKHMVHISQCVAPRTQYQVDYDSNYQRFVTALKERGYL